MRNNIFGLGLLSFVCASNFEDKLLAREGECFALLLMGKTVFFITIT